MRTPSLRLIVIVGTLLILSTLLYSRNSSSAYSIWRYTPLAHHGGSGGRMHNNRPGIGRVPVSNANPLQSPQLINFWSEFVQALNVARPTASEIHTTGKASHEDETVDMRKARTHPRLDITKMEEKDIQAMKESHNTIIQSIKVLAPKLSYQSNTAGIAMTAGGRYFGVAITSVRMLRRTGSELPVEVYLDSWKDYDIATCEEILPALNARCLVMEELWNSTPEFASLEKYQYKVFALLFSSFEDVLFLDADAFPAHNPDVLLANEPYISSGLVTWPDFWVSTTSHYFYDIAGIAVPPLDARRSSESGIMIYSKRKHADSLLLAAYYNYYGPKCYYPLFSQGAQGEGDKESFLHAALALQKDFYDVKTPVRVIGSVINGTWNTAGMMQSDPMEDYAIQLRLAQNPLPPAKTDEELVLEELDWTEERKEAAAKKRKDEEEALYAHPYFIHNNLVKLDVKHLFEALGSWRDESGKVLKLWGKASSIKKLFGYDAERVLWEELVGAACQIDADFCRRTKEHVQDVYSNNVEDEADV